MNILLFDVDGVLIEDRGYRAGVQATINYYSRAMGQADLAPDPSAIEIFQAHGYTNEWDICPFAVGMLIVAALHAQPDLSLVPAPLDRLLPQFRSTRIAPIDYREWITATRDRPGRPSERALAVLSDALVKLTVSEAARAAASAAFGELLADPYDFSSATVTQMFQEHVLGSTLFEEVYRRRPRFDLPSLLFDEDRPAIIPIARVTLLRLQSRRGARICVYTARPSLPPSDIADWLTDPARAPVGFSPEAELALQIAGLGDLPLIAMGRMQWLAAQVGTKVEYVTKPAPVQALAAILAAITQRESESLVSAYRLVSEGEMSEMLLRLRGQSLDIWVVEDAALGIHAASGAVDLLRKHEIDASLHALGVSAGGPKADALSGLCEAIFPTVNEAIAHLEKVVNGK